MKKGVIYRQGDATRGGIRIFESLKRIVLLFSLKSISYSLITFSLVFGLFIYGPTINEEANYLLGRRRLSEEILINKAEADQTKIVQDEAKKYGVNSYFSIVIPKIGATSNIFANIDIGNEAEYMAALQHGVAHAKGTYFPGQGKQIYLFSHSTNAQYNVEKYNAIFYLLSKLEKNDLIVVFFADKKYIYSVDQKVIVDPRDTKWLSERNEETLILQTCYPPGTSLKRLLVIAKPL